MLFRPSRRMKASSKESIPVMKPWYEDWLPLNLESCLASQKLLTMLTGNPGATNPLDRTLGAG